MTSMLHDPLPLPLATTAAFTPGRSHSVAQAGPWQMALARAAATIDATPPAAGRAAAAIDAAPPAAGPSASAKVGNRSKAGTSIPANLSLGADKGSPTATLDTVRSHLSQQRAPGTASSLAESVGALPAEPAPALQWPRPQAAQVAATEPEGRLQLDAKGAASDPDPEAATRIHVEQQEHGEITVWIGADGDAATVASKAAAVLAELQRALPLAGHRLARLVCNGAPLYTAPHLERETS